MTTHFLRSYSLLCIRTCHRRGAFAMGGMAAQIPIKNDPVANEQALAKVRADKEREAGDGHDGTWVAHPALVSVAMEVFDRLMPAPNQVHRLREDVQVGASDLLAIPPGTITAEGLAKIDAEIARQSDANAAALSAGDKEAAARAARELRYWTRSEEHTSELQSH